MKITKIQVRFAVLFLVVLLAALSTLNAQPSETGKVSAEFGNYFETVKKLNPAVKDFHKMNVGEVYGLPNNQTDHLEAGDLDGIWGRELKKWIQIHSDPTTSGPAMVSGGINPNETERLRSYFDGLYTGAKRISGVESGTLTGPGEVSYSNGTTQHHVITDPIRAYRATFRYPDGHLETDYALQGCMNAVSDGRYGTVYRGEELVFTPDTIVVPKPEEQKDPPPPVAWWVSYLPYAVFVLMVGLVGGPIYFRLYLPWKKKNAEEDQAPPPPPRGHSFPVGQFNQQTAEVVEKPKRIRAKRPKINVSVVAKTSRSKQKFSIKGDTDVFDITENDGVITIKAKK